jgi:hypothetical protein
MIAPTATIGPAVYLTMALAVVLPCHAAELQRPELVKLPFAIHKGMENTPLVFQGRPILLMNRRDDTKVNTDGYLDTVNCYILDLQTGEDLGTFAEGHSFINGIVDGERLHVFATEGTNREWFQSIYHFWTDDLKTWQRELAIEKGANENLFNPSVCRDDQGFLMAYESNQPVQFCFRFARSKDLSQWETIPGLNFAGEHQEYSACPAIRYFAPYYYVIYLHAATPEHPGWTSYIARSKDLATWELSPMNPVLEAGPGEGHNNSDVDLFELDGKTYLYYATGDQATWCSLRVAMHPGPMKEFLEGWFPAGAQGPVADARTPAPAAAK